MQFDVNVNMTVEVDKSEWEDFLYSYMDEDEDGNMELDGSPEDYIDEYLESLLDGEEMPVYGGRAWICTVDSGSILEGND